MPAAVARSMLDVAEFVAVTVWPVAARQQRRVAILASRVPVPNHPNDGNAHCPRQKRICRWLGEFVDRQAGSAAVRFHSRNQLGCEVVERLVAGEQKHVCVGDYSAGGRVAIEIDRG